MTDPIAPRKKSETLSLRLDPKTRFILEFIARYHGQTITTAVERAIKDVAAQVGFGIQWHNDEKYIQRTWSHFWDVSEGVRTLQLISDPECPTTYEEDELREFAADHWEFFYADTTRSKPKRAMIDVLWPKIPKYLEIWRQKKSEDYWAIGTVMVADIRAAKLQPPQWPRSPSKPTAPSSPPPAKPSPLSTPTKSGTDLDEDIPF